MIISTTQKRPFLSINSIYYFQNVVAYFSALWCWCRADASLDGCKFFDMFMSSFTFCFSRLKHNYGRRIKLEQHPCAALIMIDYVYLSNEIDASVKSDYAVKFKTTWAYPCGYLRRSWMMCLTLCKEWMNACIIDPLYIS